MALDELYQDLILEHYRNPHRKRHLDDSEVLIDEENPTCGDHIRLSIRLDGDRIVDVAFDGEGCAISMASASMMADRVVGMSISEARRLSANFVAVVRGEKEADEKELRDLVALEGVRKYPLRVKCATLAWHALDKALDRLTGATT